MKKTFKKIFNDIGRCLKATHKTVSYVVKRSNKTRIGTFFDLIWCRLVYQISLREYEVFEFYLIGANKRGTYLSMREYEKMKKKLYSKEILHILNNKPLFFERLKKFIGREIINVNEMSFKEFEIFAHENHNLIGRSKTKSFLSSYKIYHLADFRSHAWMLEQIKNDNNVLVEKEFEEDPLLHAVDEDFTTIVIITLHYNGKTSIVSACVKIKEEDKLINGYIDVNNLCIRGHLRDNNNKIYDKNVDGYKIPSLENAFKLVSLCARELSEIREIEWSVCIDKYGKPYLVDANVSEDLIFEQTPEYLNNRIGLRGVYLKYLNRIKRW